MQYFVTNFKQTCAICNWILSCLCSTSTKIIQNQWHIPVLYAWKFIFYILSDCSVLENITKSIFDIIGLSKKTFWLHFVFPFLSSFVKITNVTFKKKKCIEKMQPLSNPCLSCLSSSLNVITWIFSCYWSEKYHIYLCKLTEHLNLCKANILHMYYWSHGRKY